MELLGAVGGLRRAASGRRGARFHAVGVGPGLMGGGAAPRVPGEDIQLTGEGDPTRLGQQMLAQKPLLMDRNMYVLLPELPVHGNPSSDILTVAILLRLIMPLVILLPMERGEIWISVLKLESERD